MLVGAWHPNSGPSWSPFLSNHPSPTWWAPPGDSKGRAGSGRGSPAPQLTSPTLTLPSVLARVQYVIVGGRPGHGSQVLLTAGGAERDGGGKAGSPVGTIGTPAQPWELEFKAICTPSTRPESEGKAPLFWPSCRFFSLFWILSVFRLLSPCPLCVRAMAPRPPTWLHLTEARLL